MSTFKEAQPRKVPVDNNVFSKPKVSAKTVEELAESRFPNPSPAEQMLLDQAARTPIMAMPDYSPFQLRTAALQAAVTLQTNPGMGFHPQSFWSSIEHFEAYLRDGAKPV